MSAEGSPAYVLDTSVILKWVLDAGALIPAAHEPSPS